MKVLYDMNNHTVFICLASKETSHISIPLFLANTPLPRALFLNESLNQYLGPDRSLQSIRRPTTTSSSAEHIEVNN